MTLLINLPILVKVIASLGLILVLNRFVKELGIAVAVGTLVLAVWLGHTPASGFNIVRERFFSVSNFSLLLVVFQVIWLSSQMAAAGVMQDLVTAVRSHLSQRASMALLPALIGLLPMPGGALFSAPLVGDCDRDGRVTSDLKACVNHWFRHVWEYWWPLYPGVILAMAVTGLSVVQFVLMDLPLTLAALCGGWWFLLRKLHGAPPEERGGAGAVVLRLVQLLAPVAAVIGISTCLRIVFPALTRANAYAPMIFGLIGASLVMQFQRPLHWPDWRKILTSRRTFGLAILVAIVRIYGAFIEKPLPSGLSPISTMREELATWNIPVLFVIVLLPLISGLVCGLAVGFVGASFPIVVSLLGPDPPLPLLMATTMLAYGFGHTGMMLSPVHVCFVVTNQHFGSRLYQSARLLLGPAAVVMVSSILLYLLFRLAAGV